MIFRPRSRSRKIRGWCDPGCGEGGGIPLRILFLANKRPDFLQDIVFHGLVSVLGPENVVEHPPLPRYRGGAPGGRYPMLAFDFPEPERAPLNELAAGADAIVIGSLRPGVIESVRSVLELWPRPPTAFIDGEDDPYIRGIVREVDIYFKRELLLRTSRFHLRIPGGRFYHGWRYGERWDPLRRQVGIATPLWREILPLPFAIVDVGFVPAAERRYDVAFLATPTSTQRLAVIRDLEALRAEGLTINVRRDAALSWDEYMSTLAGSRIGVSVRGRGFDTYRYWEVPYLGALLLSESPKTVILDNFEPGVEAVFAPVRSIAREARDLLSSGDVSAIAARGREKLLRAHTSVQRAERVLEALETARIRGRWRSRRGRACRMRGNRSRGPDECDFGA